MWVGMGMAAGPVVRAGGGGGGPVSTAPANSALPGISGTATQGQVLTATAGTWAGTAPITYAYQWQRGAVNIAGAVLATYTAQAADVGLALRVVVTAANGTGSASATSAATAVVTAAAAPQLNRNVRVLVIGDSTSAGVGADPTGTTDVNGARVFSAPVKAKDWLNQNGVPALAETVAADNNVDIVTWPAYRPDISIVGSLSTSSRSPTAGGSLVRFSSSNSITFTTTEAVNTLRFAYPRVSGFGVMQLSVDDVAHSTYDENMTPEDYFVATVTGLPLAVHKFTFSRFSGTPHSPGYINAWNSAQPSVQIINAGARNWLTSNWVSATYPASALNALATIAPDIGVIDIGINDYRQSGTTIAECKARIQTIINRLVLIGARVILSVPNPIISYNTVTDAWSQAAVLTMYQELAAANAGSVLLNMPEIYALAGLGAANPATYSSLSAAGHMFDSFHPKAPVYAAEGNALGAAIKNLCVAQGWVA